MSTVLKLVGPNLLLPWYSTSDEDQRFSKVLAAMLVVFCIFAIAIPFIPVPEKTREEKETLPPELARVILEKKELPKPPPPKPKPIEKKKIEKKIEPKKKPKPEKKPVKKPLKKPEVTLERKLERAKEKAATSGLLQFQDDLQAMRDSLDVGNVSSANLTRGDQKAKQVDRSVISSQAKVSSGGINTASLSRDTGGVALSGRETTKVKSKLADQKARASKGSTSGKSTNRTQPARSDEGIRKVMDRNKGSIFAIYNRALRRNPALEGKVTVKIVINPNGQVANISLVSSQLDDPDLEKKLMSRIRLINFGAGSVTKTTLNYSFDFLPN